ncbi:MAG TPA: LCP family protein [Anaerolineae bacterium]|nr:LCP family protein [Anaerolineae bacterium]
MTSQRSSSLLHSSNRLLLVWLVGFAVIGFIAACIFFNLVRDLVRNWSTTALVAPAASSVTVTDPKTGQPVVPEIKSWDGVERVTVLLLGIDERHQETGPFRTDTMLVLTVDPVAKTAGILSIPRDLWVTIPTMDTEGKINTAHFLGDAYNYPGGGPALAMETVKQELGIPVDYYVRFNFDSFEKVIDAIGGVDICVAETIDDPEYPAFDNYGFDPLHIDAGCQHMNGSLALKYARTRHTGTDFDRAKRQQQVILAVRDKVVKQNLLPQLAAQAPTLLDELQKAVRTNLTLDQMIQLAKLATQIDPKNIKQATINENMVVAYNTPTDPPQNVLVPIRDKIRELRDQFFNSVPTANPIGTAPAPLTNAARIRVENGTQINGLAARTRDRLAAQGFTVVEIDSADRFDYAQSQIISYAADTGVAEAVAQALSLPASSIVTSTANSTIDLKVILGRDYREAAVTPTP